MCAWATFRSGLPTSLRPGVLSPHLGRWRSLNMHGGTEVPKASGGFAAPTLSHVPRKVAAVPAAADPGLGASIPLAQAADDKLPQKPPIPADIVGAADREATALGGPPGSSPARNSDDVEVKPAVGAIALPQYIPPARPLCLLALRGGRALPRRRAHCTIRRTGADRPGRLSSWRC